MVPLHPFVERSSRKGCQVIEGRNVEALLSGEVRSDAERLMIVVVVSENEGGVQSDLVPAQVCKRHFIASLHRVEAFTHLTKGHRVQAFEPHQQTLATAAGDQLEEFFVVSSVDAGLRHPANAEGYQRAKEFLCLIHVGGDVIVDKEKEISMCPRLSDLRQDLIDRASCLRGREIGLNRA